MGIPKFHNPFITLGGLNNCIEGDVEGAATAGFTKGHSDCIVLPIYERVVHLFRRIFKDNKLLVEDVNSVCNAQNILESLENKTSGIVWAMGQPSTFCVQLYFQKLLVLQDHTQKRPQATPQN